MGQDFISPKRRHNEARVAVLTVEGHEGKIYELAGDEANTGISERRCGLGYSEIRNTENSL